MAETKPPHPFRLRHIFFLKSAIERPERLLEQGVDLRLSTEIALGLPEDGMTYNLNLRVRSVDESSAGLRIELVAVVVFEHTGDGEPTVSELAKFINEHLLVAMTSRVIQLVGTLTNQMGMPAIWLPPPGGFGLEVSTVKQLIDTFQTELEL